MTLWKWSQTASNNATADSTVNWAEGQAAKTVNDSARAMMSAVAKWRDDLAGTIATTGTADAYVIASNQVLGSLTNGFSVAFRPHVSNNAGCTVNVDSLGPKPLRIATGASLDAGVLIANCRYTVTYILATDEWLLQGRYDNTIAVPIGTLLPYAGTSSPTSNLALAYGQAISRTTYATLFTALGTAYGTGDGSTTFNIPDLRGRTLFGKDDMGGSPANRVTSAGSGVTGTTLGASGGAETVTLAQSALPNVTLSGTTDSQGVHTHDIKYTQRSDVSTGGGAGAVASISSGGSNTAAADALAAGAHSHNITTASINGNVTQTAVNKLPPGLICNWLIRVL